VAQSGIDDDGIHEIFLLASFGVGYTLSRIKIDPENIVVFNANDKPILEIKREDLSEMTVSELGRRLVEAASKGKK
jgi:hypothetical protein